MRKITCLKLLLIFLLHTSLTSYSQSSKDFVGMYESSGGAMIINPDNSFLIIGYGTLVKGKVIITDSLVTLVPYKPEKPFVLYARHINSELTGNKIMFHGDDIDFLINCEKSNNEINKMKKLINDDANCKDYPVVLKNDDKNKKIYLSLKDDDKVYVYENKDGFNDFIVATLPEYKKTYPPITFIRKNNAIFDENIKKEKSKTTTSETENTVNKLISMYERAFPESEYFYVNPAYNFFEERGININYYKKIKGNKNEYFYVSRNDYKIDKDYHNASVIYEYKKMNLVETKTLKYTVEEKPIFIFKCD